MKFSVIKRIFNDWSRNNDITLNMNSTDPTDDDIRLHDRYPFGKSRPHWITDEDEFKLKEDFIAMRRLIKQIEAQETTYVAISILKDNDTGFRPVSQKD